MDWFKRYVELGFSEDQARRLIKNGEYWRKRAEELERSRHMSAVEYSHRVHEMYAAAIRDIEEEVAKWYVRFATNEGITLTEAKRLLNTRELKEFRMSVEEYVEKGESLDPAFFAELERASVKVHVSRLEALKIQMQCAAENVRGQVADSFDEFAAGVYSDQYYKTFFEIQKGTGVGFSVMKLDDKLIDKVITKPWALDGKNFSERIWGNTKKLVNELDQTLTRGIIQGKSSKKMIEELAGRMGVSESNTARLIHTESAFFASKASLDGYKQLGVEQYEILATLDNRTSDICQSMDGKVFKLSEYEPGVTAPPFHVRCRTTTVPYFDDEFEIEDSRAARDSEGRYTTVPASMKYKEWRDTFIQ